MFNVHPICFLLIVSKPRVIIVYIFPAAHQASQRRESPWLSLTPSPAIQLSQTITSPSIPPPKMAKTLLPLHMINGLKASVKKAAHQRTVLSHPDMSAHQTLISAPAAPTPQRGSRYATMRTVTGAHRVRVQRRWRQRRRWRW